MSGIDNEYVRMEGISKSFPGVQALDDVAISVRRGEIHALIGENGAGKSTLIKILMGAYQKDAGSIYIDGARVDINSPLEARRYGLNAVYQEMLIAPKLSVGENLLMGKMPVNRLGIVDWPSVYEQSRDTLRDLALDIDPRKKIADLPLAERAMATIAKVVGEKANLIIFDEPTARLTTEEVETLFAIIRRLRQENIAIIYISHWLEEIFELCDRVTVLKDGQQVGTYPVAEVDEDTLVSMMVGRSLEEMYGIKRVSPGEKILEVQNLTVEPYFSNVSFSLRQGEVLGFFGLVGSGRTPLMRAIFGAESPDAGQILVRGEPVRITSPTQAVNNAIGMVPEDRRLQGLAMPLSVKHNINMTSYGDISVLGVVRQREEAKRSQRLVARLNIRTPSLNQIVAKLSGGNQQKVAIAKWLAKDADILILDEPTVGVDVGAKVEIYHMIEDLIALNKAVILISSYLPEVIGLADRIIVMAEGNVMGEVSPEAATEERLLRMASKLEV